MQNCFLNSGIKILEKSNAFYYYLEHNYPHELMLYQQHFINKDILNFTYSILSTDVDMSSNTLIIKTLILKSMFIKQHLKFIR